MVADIKVAQTATAGAIADSTLLYFYFMRTFCAKFHVRSIVQMELNLVDVWLGMWTKMVQKGGSNQNADKTTEKFSVHKCQNLAVLDRTFSRI